MGGDLSAANDLAGIGAVPARPFDEAGRLRSDPNGATALRRPR